MEYKAINIMLSLNEKTVQKIDERIEQGLAINRQEYIRTLIYSDLVE